MNKPHVIALFQTQHGVASMRQLLSAGASRRSVDRARSNESIVPVLPGVFMLAGTTLSFHGRCMAALLYLGPRAYLAGVSAAALHGCRDMPRRTIHAVVPATAWVGPLPPWLRVRRSCWEMPGDVVTRPDGLRVSSPLRTLFDLAAHVTQYRLERVAEDLWHLDLASPQQAADYLETVRRSGRSGVARLETLLERTVPRARPSQSGFELDVIDAIRAVGLPEPERQHPLVLLNGELIHIDIAWPAIQFGLEPGHSWWHGGNRRMHADIARDNACGEIGWYIRRLEEDFRRDLPAGARLIRSLYDARRATFRPAVQISTRDLRPE